jgi:hypothetical protein
MQHLVFNKEIVIESDEGYSFDVLNFGTDDTYQNAIRGKTKYIVPSGYYFCIEIKKNDGTIIAINEASHCYVSSAFQTAEDIKTSLDESIEICTELTGYKKYSKTVQTNVNAYTNIPFMFQKGKTYLLKMEISPKKDLEVKCGTFKNNAYVDDDIIVFNGNEKDSGFVTFVPSAYADNLRVKISQPTQYTIMLTVYTTEEDEQIKNEKSSAYYYNNDFVSDIESVAGLYPNVIYDFIAGARYHIKVTASKSYNSDIELATFYKDGYVDHGVAYILAGNKEVEFDFIPTLFANRLRFIASRNDGCTYHVTINYKNNVCDAYEIRPPRTAMKSFASVFNSYLIGNDIQEILVNYKQEGDTLANGQSKIAYYDGYLYVAQVQHDDNTTGESVYLNNYIRLNKISMETWTVVAAQMIAERGESYAFTDGNTYTYESDTQYSSPYSAVIQIDGDYIYVLHSATISTGTRLVCCKINPSTLNVVSRTICSCTGDVQYLNANKNDFLMFGTANIEKKNGYYYGAVSKNSKPEHIVILKTADFVTYTYFCTIPAYPRLKPYAEVALAFDTFNNKDYLYLCVRNGYNFNRFNYIFKIDFSTMEIKEVAMVQDCHTQPNFIRVGGALYLHAGTSARNCYSFIKIDSETLAASDIIADIDERTGNANTSYYVDSSNNIYCTMSNDYVAKFRLDNFSSSDARQIVSELLT